MESKSSELSMVRMQLDAARLTAFAAQQKLIDDDLGYATHRALRRLFGRAGPQPIRLLDAELSEVANSGAVTLLGYTTARDTLSTAKSVFPDLQTNWSQQPLEQLLLTPPEFRTMPDKWVTGSRYHFEVKVRPVRRASASVHTAKAANQTVARGGERDAFLSALDTAGGKPVDRQGTYESWLIERFGLGASMVGTCRMISFRRSKVYRSSHSKSGVRIVEGPEAILAGRLQIKDPIVFDQLIRRGVGRHVAFGYGMILLKPDVVS